jgi:Protein of unknown function (DUF3341)
VSRTFLAEFDTPERLFAATCEVRQAGHEPLDAFTPFPLAGLDMALPPIRSHLRVAMLGVGLLVAAGFYFMQWWSAVYDYPLNLGGRPLNSWPVFLLAPFEVGVLAAAVAGVVAFCYACGLPRLHHPLFEVPGFERASVDRFFLLARSASSNADDLHLRHLLEGKGALVVSEVRLT